MQNSTSQEKQYITLILKKISTEIQLGEPNDWQQRDFENLSLLIEEKTGINLSVSTLKRITKNQFTKIPQKNTLNALAQYIEYKDWFDFKANHLTKIKKIAFRFFYIPLALIAAIIILIIVFKSQPVQSYSEVKFSSRKNVSEGVPNTVIFDYDISMYDFKEASIQQSWDGRRRAEIKKDEKYSTSVYYYPGYHQAKLFIDEQMVKEIPVYITTDGWLSVINNPKNELIPVYVKENCMVDSKIHISPEIIGNYNIDLETNNHRTSFYYVNEEFNGNSDNFTFETGFKNSQEEGALVCQGCEISILSEFGRHFVQLCDSGCIGELYLKFGAEYISGENNDLSAFGTDLNNWNNLKIEIKEKIVTVTLNNLEIFKTSYENSIGEIKGLLYGFKGSGAIDYARLYDSENNVVFTE
ncbi:MAG: hypothetical protein HQ541_09380, partial [Mariniphaga sp.]|nr:hypothetical protein [Mariniphaga sp.]